MHFTPSSLRRTVLARQRTLRAAGDYTALSSDDLIREAAELHAVLADSDHFGRAASLGIRRIVLDRLLAIDAEHGRRIAGTWPTAA